MTNDVPTIITTFYEAIIQQRDPYEQRHGPHVAVLSAQIAEVLGLPPEERTLLKIAAHLHDVGKIGLPENVLNKPGRYTRPEYVMVQSHTQIGLDLLKPFTLGALIEDVILHHHERYDGSGYPNCLRGRSISLYAEIVAITDVYDALTADRPYRAAMSHKDAINIITQDRAAYNPAIFEAFLQMFK